MTSVNKKSVYFIIILISLILGLIIGIGLDEDPILFFKYLSIGVWIIYTLRFFDTIKTCHDYHSPHNSSSLLIFPHLIGIFFSMWGDISPLFTITHPDIDNFGILLWNLIFSVPFLIYGNFILYLTFKKFIFIYIGTNGLNSKKMGVFISLFFEFLIIYYLLVAQGVIVLDDTTIDVFDDLERHDYGLNIVLLCDCLIIGFVTIVFGFIRPRTGASSISSNSISRRISSIDGDLDRARDAERDSRIREQDVRQRRETERARRERERAKKDQQLRDRKKQAQKKRSSSTQRSKTQKSSSSGTKMTHQQQIKYYNKIRPKSGVISEDDFKCVFCFDLPVKGDKSGIVICPHCRHPAHYDEFIEWTLASNLCSRCGGDLPRSFRTNPTIIPTNRYLDAMKYLLKNRRNK